MDNLHKPNILLLLYKMAQELVFQEIEIMCH